MSKDKYILLVNQHYDLPYFSNNKIEEWYDKVHEYYNSKEYKISLLQADFNKILKGDKLFPYSSNSALKYIDKQNIQASIKH